MKPQMFLRSAIQFYSKPSRTHRPYASGTTELNISGAVITILSKNKPIEPALEPLVPFLSHKLITSIIKGCIPFEGFDGNCVHATTDLCICCLIYVYLKFL
ncbi:hypothetical protein YC2023_093277 [Brassica napus]|uniref:(rape) hypothetical protein n=1 Tax=Brassica napus TaxID=3708 RepID=A0A816ZI94_BRANA|nr:unnamed protein product [Brassica napus]